jgi:hypothetical protein
MIQKKVQKRRDAEFKKATVQTALDKAEAEATTKEEKQFFDTNSKQLSALEKRLDGAFSDEEKEEGGLRDQLEAQRDAKLAEIQAGFIANNNEQEIERLVTSLEAKKGSPLTEEERQKVVAKFQ